MQETKKRHWALWKHKHLQGLVAFKLDGEGFEFRMLQSHFPDFPLMSKSTLTVSYPPRPTMSSLSRILLLLPYLSFSVSAGSFKHGSLNPDSYAVTSSYMTLQQPYYPPNADCQDFMVPVDIIYDNYVFNASRWEDDYDLTNFLTLATTRAGARYPVPLTGPQATGGVHNIAATFCTPKKQTDRANNVIIATHGIGPARAHWNPSYEPNEYNFVLHAIKEGYSVFFYDRLGCGASDKYGHSAPNVVTRLTHLADSLATLPQSSQQSLSSKASSPK